MYTILIIDDEQEMCSFVKDVLEQNGEYIVLTANSGKEGIKLARREEPDLILLDIRMPDISGMEVLKKLKNDCRTSYMSVIMLTGVSSEEIQIDACHEFADSYIVKPFDPDDLKAAVARTLTFHTA